MRPFHFYSTVFPFFSVATFVAADTETNGSQDPRISSSEEWERIPFDTGAGGTLSCNIKTSGIASLSMYMAPPQTAPVISVALPDTETETETTNKPATSGSLPPDSRSGRTTQSTWHSDPPTPELSTPHLPPTASSTFPAQQSDKEPVLSGGKLAAVIAVCIAIPTLIIAGTFQYRRKMLSKRKAASTAYLESIATREHGPPRPPFSPMPPDEKFGEKKVLIHLGSAIGDSTRPPTIATAL